MKSKNILLIICLISLSLISLTITSAITIKDVSSSPNEIVPGEIASVSIEIENIFEENVKNLNIKLDLSEVPFAPYQSSSEKYLEELDDGDEETFTFKLITLPETDTGIYKIPVNINYEYEGENKTKKDLISLIVNSKPELKVSLEDSVVLIKGKENEISIKIVNSGLSDTKFVYLETLDISGIKFLGEKEQYLGDIDSDDFDSIDYQIYLSPDAPKLISLPVSLKYKDSTNKEYTETKIIVLNTYSLKEAQDIGLVKKQDYTLYIVIGTFILGYVIYRILKKRKLKKKKED
jgi:hypothetical protein